MVSKHKEKTNVTRSVKKQESGIDGQRPEILGLPGHGKSMELVQSVFASPQLIAYPQI